MNYAGMHEVCTYLIFHSDLSCMRYDSTVGIGHHWLLKVLHDFWNMYLHSLVDKLASNSEDQCPYHGPVCGVDAPNVELPLSPTDKM